jgi:protein-S-isoprenylcysteine O-methyltransferase Ste14
MKTREGLPVTFLFNRQFQHLLLLACLIPGAMYLAEPALDGSTFLGVADRQWFYASLLFTMIHQVVVWFVFRTQLIFGLFTKLFGRADLAVWGAIFFPLFATRPVLLLGLGIADAGSLEMEAALRITIVLILLPPVFYTVWSVIRYFGVRRALGGDHFRDEYRKMELVRDGIFRYSPDAMYTFAFLALWSIALLTGSRAALAVALFQHAYIWVHMFCTEEPDMKVIYNC